MASAIPGAGVFNAVGVQAQQATNEKTQSAEGMDAAAELTLQGEAMLTCSYIDYRSINFFWWTLWSYLSISILFVVIKVICVLTQF